MHPWSHRDTALPILIPPATSPRSFLGGRSTTFAPLPHANVVGRGDTASPDHLPQSHRIPWRLRVDVIVEIRKHILPHPHLFPQKSRPRLQRPRAVFPAIFPGRPMKPDIHNRTD